MPDRQVAAIDGEFITAAARERNRTDAGMLAGACSFCERGCSIVFCQHQEPSVRRAEWTLNGKGGRAVMPRLGKPMRGAYRFSAAFGRAACSLAIKILLGPLRDGGLAGLPWVAEGLTRHQLDEKLGQKSTSVDGDCTYMPQIGVPFALGRLVATAIMQ